MGQRSRSKNLRCGGEGSGNEIGGGETSKFGSIPQFGDFRSIENTTHLGGIYMEPPPYKHPLSMLCFRYYENHPN